MRMPLPTNDTVARSAPAVTTELARTSQRLAPASGDHETVFPQLWLHRRNAPTEPLHCLFPLGLAVTTQGDKQVTLGGTVFAYGPGESMLTTVDLPVAAQITRATVREPYLGITLRFDSHTLTEALSHVPMPPPQPGARVEPLSVQRLDMSVLDALLRLLRLLEEPRLLPHVAPLVQREILIRLLHGPHGAYLAHLAAEGTPQRRLVDCVAWMKQHYAEPLRVDALASRAHMSPSTFRQHFRGLTGMSPVQFQKRLRLQEARQLMLNDGASAAGASALVGYESASQFNREYRRLFGAPPQRDVRHALSSWDSDGGTVMAAPAGRGSRPRPPTPGRLA
ncbi:MAG: AraC family transcriptional regulator [Vicinamibacterales bacterium]